MEVIKVVPLDEIKGTIELQDDQVIFTTNSAGENDVSFSVKNISEMFKRVYKLDDVGLEFSINLQDTQNILYIAFGN